MVAAPPLATQRPRAYSHGACVGAQKPYSSVSDGQMWWASVIVDLSGLSVALALSGFTCSARRIRIRRENAVYDEILQDHPTPPVAAPIARREMVSSPPCDGTKWHGPKRMSATYVLSQSS